MDQGMSTETKTITDTVTDLGNATAHEVLDTAKDQYASVVAAIRRSPLQSAGIAAGVGFTLALVARGFGGNKTNRSERHHGH